jgi:branched-chain amino acid transport system substrate-binding protein
VLVAADHQNKPDVGLAIAREWLERDNVDAIADMANSAIALGVNTLIGEKKRVGLFVSPLTDRPTEADCNGQIVAWAYDAHSTVGTTVRALLAEGGKKFFILSPDYEAGKVQEAAVEAAVVAGGGEINGKVRAPLGTTDFSSYLLRAQSSGAQAIIMNVSGPELINAMKQVQEFGLIDAGMKIAVTFMHQSDVRSIGNEALKGVRFSAPWFWKKDDASAQFGKRMMEITGNAPGWIAAGTYSAVTNYLKAVEKAGTDDSASVLKAMRDIEIKDFFVQNGKLFPNGRLVHDMYLLEVKTPREMTEKHDFLKLVSTVPAAQAFKSYDQSACKLK